MASTFEELDRRLDALSERMGSGQNPDLRSMASALSAQTHILEALALSDMQHTENLAGLRREMRELRGETRQIADMLTTLIERDDAR